MKSLTLFASFLVFSVSSLFAGEACCSAHAVSASGETVQPVKIQKAQFPAEGITTAYVQKAADAGCPATAALQARMKAAASASATSCCSTAKPAVQQASAKPAELAGAECCAAELATAQAASKSDDCCAEAKKCGEECTVVAAESSSTDEESAAG